MQTYTPPSPSSWLLDVHSPTSMDVVKNLVLRFNLTFEAGSKSLFVPEAKWSRVTVLVPVGWKSLEALVLIEAYKTT